MSTKNVAVGRRDDRARVTSVSDGPRDSETTWIDSFIVLNVGVGGVQSNHFTVFDIVDHAVVFCDSAELGAAVIRHEPGVATVGDYRKQVGGFSAIGTIAGRASVGKLCRRNSNKIASE